MRLIGYEVDRTAVVSQTLRLGIYWQVTRPPPSGEDDAFFVHLLDERQQVIGQHDGLDYPPVFWRTGDTVLSWFTVPVSPLAGAGPAWLEVGVYRRSDIGRLAIRLADGTTTQRVLLGPIKVVAAGSLAAAAGWGYRPPDSE